MLDGDLGEWDVVPDAYVLRPRHHVELNSGETLTDDADLDFRIIVGWSDATNRLYFMVIVHVPRRAGRNEKLRVRRG